MSEQNKPGLDQIEIDLQEIELREQNSYEGDCPYKTSVRDPETAYLIGSSNNNDIVECNEATVDNSQRASVFSIGNMVEVSLDNGEQTKKQNALYGGEQIFANPAQTFGEPLKRKDNRLNAVFFGQDPTVWNMFNLNIVVIQNDILSLKTNSANLTLFYRLLGQIILYQLLIVIILGIGTKVSYCFWVWVATGFVYQFIQVCLLPFKWRDILHRSQLVISIVGGCTLLLMVQILTVIRFQPFGSYLFIVPLFVIMCAIVTIPIAQEQIYVIRPNYRNLRLRYILNIELLSTQILAGILVAVLLFGTQQQSVAYILGTISVPHVILIILQLIDHTYVDTKALIAATIGEGSSIILYTYLLNVNSEQQAQMCELFALFLSIVNVCRHVAQLIGVL